MKIQDMSPFFGIAIRRLRAEFGWSQEQLAEIAELNKNFISKLERAEQQPSLETLYRIAHAFNRTGSAFLSEVEDLAARPRKKNTAR